MVTLGVPLAKCNKVVLNKELQNVVLGVDTALSEAGLDIIARIPLSMDIAIYCASGKRIYGAMSKEKGISAFNIAVDSILNTIIEKTPLNMDYLDVAKELSRMEALQKQKNADKEDEFVEEVVGEGEYSVEEFEEVLDDSYIDSVNNEEVSEGVGEEN